MKPPIPPFRFETAAALTRVAQRRASSLSELRAGLRAATRPMLFHHTYNAFLESHYVPYAPQNDFVDWIDKTLRLHSLAEGLAAVDPFDYTDLVEWRDAVLDLLDDHFAAGAPDPVAPRDQEFHFLETVGVATPTAFLAGDLREFRAALARVGVRSIHHHFLAARLRLGRLSNDFSAWLAGAAGEPALARGFEGIDPAAGTLEDARARMLALVDAALAARKRSMVVRLGLLGASVAGVIATGVRRAARERRDDGREAR